MVFAFVTPRRCPARKVTEIQTALRSSEHNHTHHRLSCSSLPTGQKLPKWSVFLKNFLFRADLPFHGKLTKTLVPSGFPDFSAGRVGYFRNFFYRLFFRPYRIVLVETFTTCTFSISDVLLAGLSFHCCLTKTLVPSEFSTAGDTL